MPLLEYAITRPYPWRWTTATVMSCGVITLVGLGLFNFAAVGYNRQSSYRDDFYLSNDVGWTNKFNTKYTEEKSITCDPNKLVIGGTYRTNNAIFALIAESLRDPITSAPLGSANYSGDALDSCRVNRIYMMAEFPTHEAKFRAQIACRTPSTLFANFTIESIVTPRAGVLNGVVNIDTLGDLTNEQSLPEAISTSALYALGLDVLGALFFFAPPVQNPGSTVNASATSLWAQWDPLSTDSDMPFVMSGVAAANGAYLQTSGAGAFAQLPSSARRAIQNYAIGLHSAILVDVGSTAALAAGQPDTNILTNLTALQSRIVTSDLLKSYMIETSGGANGINISIPAAPYVLSHTSEFRLPIKARQLNGDTSAATVNNDPGSARLVQRYLCHSLVLKPTSALIVDVLVATLSMLMVAWGIAQIGLMYVAKEHTTNGNYCLCPACDTYTHKHVPVTPDSPQMVSIPRDKDSTPTPVASANWNLLDKNP